LHIDNTTKMSYLISGHMPLKPVPPGGAEVTRLDYLSSAPICFCSVCERDLSMRDMVEWTGMVDALLYSGVLCRECREKYLVLCRECSGRYTADGLCEECAGREYGMAG
jgi:hypothetical protein